MMAFITAKANYGKPHGKASYIRSLNICSDSDNSLKDLADNGKKHGRSQQEDELSSKDKCKSTVKSIEDSKEKHLQKLTSSYTHLCSEIEKIQSWKTSVELECKKKSKKLDELSKVIESQRKVACDLQMQNEKLSSQLNEEIQQRAHVLEKFYFTKELFSVLKKKFHELQDQFEGYKKIKEISDVGNEQKLKVIEDITKKFNSMRLECSERFNYLNDALASERNTILILKNLCEQQNVSAEKERKSFCTLIEKYQDELEAASKDLENEKRRKINVEQEKEEIILRISELEANNETNLRELKETKQELKLVIGSKCETENSYKSEVMKVNELNMKCKELENISTKLKTEFEERIIDMKTTIENLEKSLINMKEKLEEFERKAEDLTATLMKTENEKNCLEDEISKAKYDREKLQDKLLNDAKDHEETISQLMMEKHNLEESLENLKEELCKAVYDKENISKLCSEKEQLLSKITSDYQSSVLKIENLTSLNEKYSLTLKKVDELENNLKLNSELLISKNLEIKEMNIVNEKCVKSENKVKELEDLLQVKSDELLLKNLELKEMNILKENSVRNENKVKELEESLQLKSEELLSKNQELKEMYIIRKKYAENQNKLKQLEDSLQLKSEELFLKEKTVEESNITKENITKAMNEINRLETDIQLKQELIFSKESKIEELTFVEEKYSSAVMKIQELEEDIHCKSDLLDYKEKIIADLKATLRENENMLDKLEYENIEMKDNLQKEKESVKICLDCEIMKEKLNEFENLQITFNQTQEELNKQKNRADRTMKMLSETEDNFDDMRVKKEKQIIKLNDSIEHLQHELRMLKLEVEDSENLKAENESLKRKIDEIILQNEGDIQRLKAENLKMKVDVELPRSQKSLSQFDSDNIDASRKKTKNSPFAQEIENDQKVEADFSHDDDVPIHKTPKSSKDSAAALAAEKKKRMWESGSSGSECLEIVFDSKAKGIKRFAPKSRTPGNVNRTPLAIPRQKLDQEKKSYLPVKTNEVYHFADNKKTNMMNHLSIKPVSNVLLKNADVNSDFLKSKENTTQIICNSTPLIKRKIPVGKGTPSTPSERKFFKTPLKERELSFKKPQSNNLWC